MGITYDPWQKGVGSLALGKRADGIYAATVGGVVLSIPRQVGKTFLIGSMIVALCVLFPGLKVIWTAHRTRTATNTFRSMQGMVRSRKISPHLAEGRNNGIRTANGEQEITFRNGSVILFGAREQGFGRGFDAVDIEVFDEAQILTEKALEDMLAATNQAQNPHGALLFYMGTPPRPIDPGEVFTNKRKKALSGDADSLVYIEFSADEDADPDDQEQWARANPSYPTRTPHESMLRLRENLPSDDAWRREALGIWDGDQTGGAFQIAAWLRNATDDEPAEPACFAVAADVDQQWLSLGAASAGPRHYLGLVRRDRVEESQAAFVADVKRLQSKYGVPVVVGKSGPASFIIEPLEAAGVKVYRADTEAWIQASAEIKLAVEADEIQHGDYPQLNEAVAGSGWRKVGDRRVLDRRRCEIDPLESVTWARWGVSNATYEINPSAVWV